MSITSPSIANLFANLPGAVAGEAVEVLAAARQLRIERIVSHGQSSPPDFWYDQEEEEWVALLQGAATLRFEQEDRLLHLRPGDHLHIPAHCRHRLEWTAPDVDTIWLAVFYSLA